MLPLVACELQNLYFPPHYYKYISLYVMHRKYMAKIIHMIICVLIHSPFLFCNIRTVHIDIIKVLFIHQLMH